MHFTLINPHVTLDLLPHWSGGLLHLSCSAPTAQVSNVQVERVISNRAALVSWTPLTLHQARGFPVYFVTYQPSSQVGRVVRAVNTVNTTDSRVVIDDHDPITKYTFTVDVGTAGGKLRGSLRSVHKIMLCHHTYLHISAVGQHYAEFKMALSISTPHWRVPIYIWAKQLSVALQPFLLDDWGGDHWP